MANFEKLRQGVSTTVKKTEKLAQTASMKARLAHLISKRDEQFEKLGKLTYKQLKTDESYAEEIAAVISQIDTLTSQIIKQKAKIEQSKAQKAAEKAQKAEEKEAKARAEQEADEAEAQNCVTNVKVIIEENKD